MKFSRAHVISFTHLNSTTKDARDKKKNTWKWKFMFGVDFHTCRGCLTFQNYPKQYET